MGQAHAHRSPVHHGLCPFRCRCPQGAQSCARWHHCLAKAPLRCQRACVQSAAWRAPLGNSRGARARAPHCHRGVGGTKRFATGTCGCPPELPSGDDGSTRRRGNRLQTCACLLLRTAALSGIGGCPGGSLLLQAHGRPMRQRRRQGRSREQRHKSSPTRASKGAALASKTQDGRAGRTADQQSAVVEHSPLAMRSNVHRPCTI